MTVMRRCKHQRDSRLLIWGGLHIRVLIAYIPESIGFPTYFVDQHRWNTRSLNHHVCILISNFLPSNSKTVGVALQEYENSTVIQPNMSSFKEARIWDPKYSHSPQRFHHSDPDHLEIPAQRPIIDGEDPTTQDDDIPSIEELELVDCETFLSYWQNDRRVHSTENYHS